MQTFKMETSKPSFKLKSLPSPRDPKQLQEMLLQPSLGSAATRTLPFSDTQSSTSKARSYSVSEAMNSSSIDSLASSAAYASLASGLVMAVDDFPSYNPCVTSRVASSSGSSVSHPSSPYPLSSNLYPNYQHKSSNSNLISHSDWNGEVHQPPVNNAHASKLNSNFLRLNLNHDSTDEPILQGAIHYYSPSEELAVSNLCHLKQPVLRSRAPSISEAYRYSRPQQPTFEHQGGTQAVRSVGSRASEFREIDHSFLPGMEVVFWTVEEFEVSQNLSGRSRSGSLQERTSPSYTRRRTGTVQKIEPTTCWIATYFVNECHAPTSHRGTRANVSSAIVGRSLSESVSIMKFFGPRCSKPPKTPVGWVSIKVEASNMMRSCVAERLNL